MTYQAIDRTFYWLTALAFAMAAALGVSLWFI
jgi:cytochrome b subunit of formate dehydrogenase